jgi:rhodanese-related sulfurtransferase
MESTTYLLRDENEKEYAIFTGDTLFLGDVGRPDLAQKSDHLTQEELAGLLYDSLRNKIMPLPDEVIVYPGHGAGSACGKHMSRETVDTLGHQKQSNYALRANMTRDEFIKEVTEGLLPPPAYFPENVKLNKEGYESIDQVLQQGLQALSPDEFEMVANATAALILDTRAAQVFAKAFIPNSINIGINGSFAPWVGALVPGVNHPILIVADEGREQEVITRLARVGYDHTKGYLKGGIDAWKKAGKETDTIPSIPAQELAALYKAGQPKIFDVRKENEFEAGHIIDAANTPLDYLNDRLAAIPKEETIYLHCAGGYRSMIAASILKARGWEKVVDIDGGFKAISETDIPRTDFARQATK